MTQFPTACQLASWAGVSPGSNESAGRVKFDQNQTRKPLPQRCSASPRCSQPARRTPTSPRSTGGSRPPENPSQRSSRSTRHHHGGLAHAHQQRVLQRSRRRLPHPARPRKDQSPAIKQLQALGYEVTPPTTRTSELTHPTF
jgi:transposase